VKKATSKISLKAKACSACQAWTGRVWFPSADAGSGPPAWCSMACIVESDVILGKPLGRGNLKTSAPAIVPSQITTNIEEKCIIPKTGRRRSLKLYKPSLCSKFLGEGSDR
jgi:hypothetical protein